MKKSQLIEELENILWSQIMHIKNEEIETLIARIKREPIRNNQYQNKYKHIDARSQKWQILIYLKNHIGAKVTWTDFMNEWFFNKKPFIWFSAGARLSELLRCWLVEKVWNKKWVMKFLFKSKDRTLYRITKRWIKYKLKK